MKKTNEYKKFIGVLDYLKSSESEITRNERELVFELEDIMKIDRSNTIIKELFNKDGKFQELLEKVNKEIKNTDLLIKSGSSSNAKKYIIRKDNLIELRDSILYYIDNQDIEIDDTKSDLIEKCLPSLNLSHYSQQLFFGKKLVEEGDNPTINKDTVSKVYDILNDTDLMNEIVVGVEKNEVIEKYNSIIKACNEALRYKNKIYENSDLIFKYNALTRKSYELNKYLKSVKLTNINAMLEGVNTELNRLLSNKLRSFINKEKVHELINKRNALEEDNNRKKRALKESEHLKYKIEEVREELKRVGLLDLFNREHDDSLSSLHSVSRLLPYFYKENDIDKYYKFIEETEKTNREHLREARKDMRDYYVKISGKGRNLLINCLDTCKTIKEFANYPLGDYEVCPAIALYILKGLVEIEDSKYEDKEFTKEEVNSIALYYEDVMKANHEAFLSEFNDIKSSNYNVKSKIK